MRAFTSLLILSPLTKPLLGVLRLALVTDLEVQARPFQGARLPHRPDALSLLHVVAFAADAQGLDADALQRRFRETFAA